MRNLSIKKLVTIATGAALVGSALVPFASAAVSDLQKSDLISASTGQPTVDIVVGSTAAVSDIVWAGNIAATLGTKANTTASVNCGGGGTCAGATPTIEGLAVDLAIGGTVTTTGGKAFRSDMNSATSASAETDFTDQNVTNSSISSLKYYGAKSYTWNGSSSYSVTMQEVLGFNADVLFDDVDAKELIMELGANDLKYEVTFGSGIPCVESAGVTTAFSDDANDNIRIPFFGKDYLINSASPTSDYIELLESAGELVYEEGDRIDGLVGKDGENYYVVIGSGGVVSSTNKVSVTLYSEDGTQIDSDYFGTGTCTFYSEGEEVLQTLLYVEQIVKTTVSDSEVYRPTILVGNSRIEIYNGKGYPYDSTKTDSEYDYTATINFSTDDDYITSIWIKNKSSLSYLGSEGLSPSETIDYPNSYGTLEFLGLQLPEFVANGVSKTERTTKITLGDHILTYYDNTYESPHSVNMYFQETMSNTSSTTISMDGKTIWFKLDMTDKNIFTSGAATGAKDDSETCIGDGNYINGEVVNMYSIFKGGSGSDDNVFIGGEYHHIGDANVDLNGMLFTLSGIGDANNCISLAADGNITFKKSTSTGTLVQEFWYNDENIQITAPVSFEGADNVTQDYVVMVDEYTDNKARVWMMWDAQAKTTQYGKTVRLQGTDTEEKGKIDASKAYYQPNSSNMPADYNGSDSFDSAKYKVAWFQIEDNDEVPTDYDFNYFVDTATGNAIALPNTNLSTYSYEAQYKEDDGHILWELSESTSRTDPNVAYSDFGSKFSLIDHKLEAVIPENRPQAEILVAGTDTTTSTTGGEDFTGVKEGETVTTTAGTTVNISAISYESAECIGGEEGEVTCTPNVDSYTMPVASLTNYLVVQDKEASNVSTHIVVGGYKVNTLAKDVVLEDGRRIEEALAKSGDYVYDRTSDGDFVVAGYTKQDTVTAATRFIGLLESL